MKQITTNDKLLALTAEGWQIDYSQGLFMIYRDEAEPTYIGFDWRDTIAKAWEARHEMR